MNICFACGNIALNFANRSKSSQKMTNIWNSRLSTESIQQSRNRTDPTCLQGLLNIPDDSCLHGCSGTLGRLDVLIVHDGAHTRLIPAPASRSPLWLNGLSVCSLPSDQKPLRNMGRFFRDQCVYKSCRLCLPKSV